jgi:hypothetical protein
VMDLKIYQKRNLGRRNSLHMNEFLLDFQLKYSGLTCRNLVYALGLKLLRLYKFGRNIVILINFLNADLDSV